MGFVLDTLTQRVPTGRDESAFVLKRRLVYQRRMLALLVGMMGLANIMSSVIVHVAARERLIHALFPLEVEHGSRHLAVVAGLALILVSRGLWRGKRWTWGLTIGLLGASAVFHLLKGLDWEEAGAATTIAVLLMWQRRAFRAQPDAPTLRRALRATVLCILGLLIYTALGYLLLRRQFAAPATSNAIWQELIARLWLDVGPLQPLTYRAHWFLASLSVFGVTLGAYIIGALIHPVVAAPAAPAERLKARDLVRRFGTSSLAPFTLLPDKSLFWGQRVSGLIAFRVAGEVAVVCGDPIAAPTDRRALLHEFMQHCAEHGWDLCLYEAQETHLAEYTALGLRTLKIGEDAWIDLAHWTLKGKPIADIRHAIAKIERDGLRCVMLHELPAVWPQLQALAAAADRGEWELQFSIGRLPATPDPAARYAVALSADGTTVLGFCAWLPIDAVNGWALDVMQRHPAAPNGTMEYVIGQSLLRFQRDGAAWASLGVAPLADADVDCADERSLLQRGVRFLYAHPKLNELYRYKSLFFFKKKFVPQWRSMYLVYSSRLSLPRILYAVLKVHLPVIGPALISELVVSQGEHHLQRRRAALQTQSQRGPDITPEPMRVEH